LIFGTAFGIFYILSADHLLQKAGLVLKLETLKKSHQLRLSGKPLLDSGQWDSGLMGEFEK